MWRRSALGARRTATNAVRVLMPQKGLYAPEPLPLVAAAQPV